MKEIIKREKIALGMITRHFNDARPILEFIENARKYGHDVHRVIAAYSHSKDDDAVAVVNKHTRLDLLNASEPEVLHTELQNFGITEATANSLLEIPAGGFGGEIPYGVYRNAVLFKALLADIDYLLFFDTDVAPKALTRLDKMKPQWLEIDFVGTHMRSLRKQHVAATTSEYSGYYIIPPMSFPGMGELLNGLGKGMALEYMEDCHDHHCLNLAPMTPGLPRPTTKPLGGNLGLDLKQPWRLAPFYSTLYTFSGMTIKGRGEDTLLGQAISASSGNIMDIDLRIFHDTYNDFPNVPDIRKKSVRDRFYWACMGWIGRNPFLSWYLDQQGVLESDWRSETTLQRIGLEIGGDQVAAYLNDNRFRRLGAAFEASFANLPGEIQQYQRLMLSWDVLLQTLGRDKPPVVVDEPDIDELKLAS